MINTQSQAASKSRHSDRSDLFSSITEQIIKAIEAGTANYEMPWNTWASQSLPANIKTEKVYRGVNVLSLWGAALERGYSQNKWGTYRQWAELGCPVRKGEKSTKVIFWDTYFDEELEKDERSLRIVAKGYSVFNAAQVDGYEEEKSFDGVEHQRIASSEAFFLNLRSDVRFGGNVASYSLASDSIRMPEIEQFTRTEGYYSVLAHEHIHWSGNKARLDRDLTGRFGDSSYAMEELIAELGAAFVCGHLGVQTDPRTDHAGYIGTWLRVLKNDPKAILTAASAAQRATDYLIEVAEKEPMLVKQGLYDAVTEVFHLSK